MNQSCSNHRKIRSETQLTIETRNKNKSMDSKKIDKKKNNFLTTNYRQGEHKKNLSASCHSSTSRSCTKPVEFEEEYRKRFKIFYKNYLTFQFLNI